jgi:hypothetical protein
MKNMCQVTRTSFNSDCRQVTKHSCLFAYKFRAKQYDPGWMFGYTSPVCGSFIWLSGLYCCIPSLSPTSSFSTYTLFVCIFVVLFSFSAFPLSCSNYLVLLTALLSFIPQKYLSCLVPPYPSGVCPQVQPSSLFCLVFLSSASFPCIRLQFASYQPILSALHFCFPLLSSLLYTWASRNILSLYILGLLYILIWMSCKPSFYLWPSINAWNFRWIF